MKSLIAKLKKLNRHRLFRAIDDTIEHHFFKPVAISIIISFVLFCGFEFVADFISDYQESALRKQRFTPIKIDISNSKINDFDLDEEQVLERSIKHGDTILKILADLGLDEHDVFAILTAMKKVFNPKISAPAIK